MNFPLKSSLLGISLSVFSYFHLQMPVNNYIVITNPKLSFLAADCQFLASPTIPCTKIWMPTVLLQEQSYHLFILTPQSEVFRCAGLCSGETKVIQAVRVGWNLCTSVATLQWLRAFPLCGQMRAEMLGGSLIVYQSCHSWTLWYSCLTGVF